MFVTSIYLFPRRLIPLHISPIHKTNDVPPMIYSHSFKGRGSVRNTLPPKSDDEYLAYKNNDSDT